MILFCQGAPWNAPTISMLNQDQIVNTGKWTLAKKVYDKDTKGVSFEWFPELSL